MSGTIRHPSFGSGFLKPEVLDRMAQLRRRSNQSEIALPSSFVESNHEARVSLENWLSGSERGSHNSQTAFDPHGKIAELAAEKTAVGAHWPSTCRTSSLRRHDGCWCFRGR
jgi:hypothetical protein